MNGSDRRGEAPVRRVAKPVEPSQQCVIGVAIRPQVCMVRVRARVCVCVCVCVCGVCVFFVGGEG